MKKIVLLICVFSCVNKINSQEIPVTFASDNLSLNGTLSVPNGFGPFPLIIFVHGSGPNDRNQTIHLTGGNAQCLYPGLYNDTIQNFKDLSKSLCEGGIAVLRYDKRTFTYPSLNPFQITPYDFIIDINSAIDFAKTRLEVDVNKIMLLGHSQGSNFIPIVASQRNDIAALIPLGTASRGIDTMMAIQFRNLYYSCLNDTITGDAYYNQTLNDFNQIRNGSWNSTVPYLGAYVTFWNDWLNITDSAIINFNNIIQPTLFLHALEDFNIPLEDAQRYDSKLTINYDLYYLNGLNHFFTTSIIPEVSQVVPDTIIYWLNQNNIVSNMIEELGDNSNKRFLKTVDVLGRETKPVINTPLFYIYDDGTVEKKIIME
jgi:pimeloyl-ACP methyl ester carboxylesterase